MSVFFWGGRNTIEAMFGLWNFRLYKGFIQGLLHGSLYWLLARVCTAHNSMFDLGNLLFDPGSCFFSCESVCEVLVQVPGPGKYAGKPGKLPDFKSTKKPRGSGFRSCVICNAHGLAQFCSLGAPAAGVSRSFAQGHSPHTTLRWSSSGRRRPSRDFLRRASSKPDIRSC